MLSQLSGCKLTLESPSGQICRYALYRHATYTAIHRCAAHALCGAVSAATADLSSPGHSHILRAAAADDRWPCAVTLDTLACHNARPNRLQVLEHSVINQMLHFGSNRHFQLPTLVMMLHTRRVDISMHTNAGSAWQLPNVVKRLQRACRSYIRSTMQHDAYSHG